MKIDTTKLTVHGPRFIVEQPEKQTRTESGLYLSQENKGTEPIKCIVKAVGTDTEGKTSTLIHVGDVVLVNSFALDLKDRQISIEDRLVLVNEADIYAIINQ